MYLNCNLNVPLSVPCGSVLLTVPVPDPSVESVRKSASLFKFVDDTKVLASIGSGNKINELQTVLEPVYSWNVRNNMEWNALKFKELRIGGKGDCREGFLFTPNFDNVLVPEEYVKDLDVLIDYKLNFKPQRSAVLLKASNKANWALRTFKCRNAPIMKRVWMSVIQPHLDYASILWFPVNDPPEIRKMETVLRAFTRRVSGLRDEPYCERLKLMQLQSQERRTERYKNLVY